MTERLMLSVDWDFFFYRAHEVDASLRVPNSEGEEVLLDLMMDWGHSEHHNPLIQQFMWAGRYVGFRRMGLDPRAVCRINCADPNEFVRDVNTRINLNQVTVNISDSHRHAYCTAQDASLSGDEPVHVIHFDAHADLGYHHARVRQHRKQGVYDCADWLLAAVGADLVHKVTVVYPDWKGLEEAKKLKKKAHIRHLPDVTFTTWAEWKEGPKIEGDVEFIHIARSGAWVPPWFDEEFDSFITQWGAWETNCLDCATGLHHVVNACTPRVWEDPDGSA